VLEPIFSDSNSVKSTPPPNGNVKTNNNGTKEILNKSGLQRLTPGMRGPSIKDALNGNVVREEKITLQEQLNAYTRVDQNDEFTTEMLQSKWTEYLQSVRNRPNLKAALSQVPEIKEGNLLELTVSNTVQLDMIRDIKPQIVAWLRTELKNSGIDLIITISDSKQERIIYTDSDKFQELAKKNPALNLLKQKFNLDFEG
jgi:hypothetical protein